MPKRNERVKRDEQYIGRRMVAMYRSRRQGKSKKKRRNCKKVYKKGLSGEEAENKDLLKNNEEYMPGINMRQITEEDDEADQRRDGKLHKKYLKGRLSRDKSENTA